MSSITIRPATAHDLPGIYDVWYAAEMHGDPDPPAKGALPPAYAHELETGLLFVAERDSALVAFASSVTRGDVTFLTDLFVRPERQSAHLGSELLRRVLPADAPIRCTLASSDPRAISLYARAGMRPWWPMYWLRAQTAELGALPTGGVTVEEARPGDPALLAMDAAICGRARPQDHAFWVERDEGVPLWFLRGGERVGYGYVHRRSPGFVWAPEAIALGVLGARSEDDALACVGAAIEWARPQAATLRLTIPGPHPAFAPLLAAHWAIVSVDTFSSSERLPFADPRRYLASLWFF